MTFACSRRPCDGCARVSGGRWKSQNRKNVYLSPYVEEPLNSKVIKSFVPEVRSRKCFSYFGIPMFYVFMLLNILCMFYTSSYGTDRELFSIHLSRPKCSFMAKIQLSSEGKIFVTENVLYPTVFLCSPYLCLLFMEIHKMHYFQVRSS